MNNVFVIGSCVGEIVVVVFCLGRSLGAAAVLTSTAIHKHFSLSYNDNALL